MVLELREDFVLVPFNDDDINVGKYGGQRIKGITFVEVFLPHDTKMPDGYSEIKDLEYTL